MQICIRQVAAVGVPDHRQRFLPATLQLDGGATGAAQRPVVLHGNAPVPQSRHSRIHRGARNYARIRPSWSVSLFVPEHDFGGLKSPPWDLWPTFVL